MSRTFSNDETTKLKTLINEGVGVMDEIEVLRGGLSDTIKAIAEELEIEPAVLKKSITIAAKARLSEENKSNEELNAILTAVGKG